MRVSENFDSIEFRCSCGCGKEDIHEKLVEVLQAIRTQLQASINITSGVRCRSKNNELRARGINAAKSSYHIPRKGVGMAADITSTNAGPLAVLKLYVLADQQLAKAGLGGGLGLYHNRIHVDVRRARARWIDPSWSWKFSP